MAGSIFHQAVLAGLVLMGSVAPVIAQSCTDRVDKLTKEIEVSLDSAEIGQDVYEHYFDLWLKQVAAEKETLEDAVFVGMLATAWCQWGDKLTVLTKRRLDVAKERSCGPLRNGEMKSFETDLAFMQKNEQSCAQIRASMNAAIKRLADKRQ